MVAVFGHAIPNPGSMVTWELLAIQEGLRIVQDKGFHQVIISSYSLLTVQTVTLSEDDLSYARSHSLDHVFVKLHIF